MELKNYHEWVSERRQLLERIKELEAENTNLRKRLGEDVVLIMQKPMAMQSLSLQEKVDLFRTLFKGRDDVFARRWYSKASGKGAISLYARTNGTTNSVISESSSVPNAQIASSRHSQTMMSSLTSHTKIRKNTHICNFIMLTNVLIVNMLVKLCNKHLSPKLTQNQSYLG